MIFPRRAVSLQAPLTWRTFPPHPHGGLFVSARMQGSREASEAAEAGHFEYMTELEGLAARFMDELG